MKLARVARYPRSRQAVTAPLAPIRAVLFDWGDTLFEPPHAPVVIVEAAAERGVTVDAERAARVWEDLWAAGKSPQEIATDRDLSAEAHRAVWTALFRPADALAPGIAKALYERVMDPFRWVPYPDAAPTLRALRERGVRVGVVSNIARDLRPVFAKHGLLALVDAFVLSYEIGAAKPEPKIFLAACEKLGVAPAETLMVGDHPLTDGGASSAGLGVFILPPTEDGADRGLARVLQLVDRA